MDDLPKDIPEVWSAFGASPRFVVRLPLPTGGRTHMSMLCPYSHSADISDRHAEIPATEPCCAGEIFRGMGVLGRRSWKPENMQIGISVSRCAPPFTYSRAGFAASLGAGTGARIALIQPRHSAKLQCKPMIRRDKSFLRKILVTLQGCPRGVIAINTARSGCCDLARSLGDAWRKAPWQNS
jgi:hypothetical protein